MTSSRLPGKVLADVGGEPLLAHLLNRIGNSKRLDDVCVATTDNLTDDPVAAQCDAMGVRVFRGDEHDVLGRFSVAADMMGAEIVVRLTGDCPMIDPQLLDHAIAEFADGDFDYFTNSLVRTYPDGLDIEIFTRTALTQADREATDPYCREHVTPYLQTGYETSPETGSFRVGELHAPADFGHLRWTVDTEADLRRVQEMVSQLPEHYGWLDAVALTTRRPDFLSGEFDPVQQVQLRPASIDDSERFSRWLDQCDFQIPGEFSNSSEQDKAGETNFASMLASDNIDAWSASIDGRVFGLALAVDLEDVVDLAFQEIGSATGQSCALRMLLMLRLDLAKRRPGKRIVTRCASLDSAHYRLLVAAGFGRTQVSRHHIVLSIDPVGRKGGQ